MRTLLLIFAGVLGLVAIAGCGADSEPPSRTTATATGTSTQPRTTTQEDAEKLPAKAPARKFFVPCLLKGGAFLVKGVEGIPASARSSSRDPFTVGFPNAKFGRQVGNVVFMPFTKRETTHRTLRNLKPKIDERRRIFLRDQMLVVFGTRGNHKTSTLVIDCLDRGIKKAEADAKKSEKKSS